MKVGILSKSHKTGKTSLALLLAHMYTIATGNRESVYTSNMNTVDEILSLESFLVKESTTERGIGIISALGNDLTSESVLDYAYRPPKCPRTLIYDIYSTSVKEEEALKNFFMILSKLDNKFIVIDINQETSSKEALQEIYNNCDCLLYTFSPTIKEAKEAREFYDNSDELKSKIFMVCNGISDNINRKHIKSIIKLNSLFYIPFNANIIRASFEGRLDILPDLIANGKDDMLGLRQPFKDLLSHLCDTSSIKVIRDVANW